MGGENNKDTPERQEDTANSLRSDRTYKRCPFCAEDILEEAIVCRYCGRDLPDEGEGEIEEQKTPLVEERVSAVPVVVEEDALKCPNCGRIDSIAKVSAIYSAGTSSASYSGPTTSFSTPIGKGQSRIGTSFSTLSGTSQTELSRKLAPPDKPTAAGISLLAIAGAIGVCLVGSCMWTVVVDQISMSGNGVEGVLPMAAIGFVAIAVLAVGIIIKAQSDAGDRKKVNQKRVTQWNRAVGKWNSLYYCAFDDGVFDPDSGRWVQIREINRLLQ